MTTGSQPFSTSVTVMCRQLVPGQPWVDHHQTVVRYHKEKAWSGADRPRRVGEVPSQGERHYYNAFLHYRRKDGKVDRRIERRSFLTRPTPNRVKRDLENTPHPYVMSASTLADEVVAVKSASTNIITEFSGEDLSAWGESFLLPLEMESSDQIKLVGRLKDLVQGSSFNLAVFLGESHQTVRMIGSTAVTLAEAFARTRKGDLRGAAHTLGVKPTRGGNTTTLAGAWLQLQYGWLPLFGDMKSGAEQLAHLHNIPTQRVYRVRLKKTGSRTYLWSFSTNEYWLRRQIVAIVTHTPSALEISGLLDPELVAWELTPFSFVVDWFLDIGGYLEARAYAGRLTGTFVTTDKRYTMAKGITTQVGFPNQATANSAMRTVTNLVRTVSSNLEVGTPKVKTLGQAASWQHMANGLALAAQAFSGKRSPDRDLKECQGWYSRDASMNWGSLPKHG